LDYFFLFWCFRFSITNCNFFIVTVLGCLILDFVVKLYFDFFNCLVSFEAETNINKLLKWGSEIVWLVNVEARVEQRHVIHNFCKVLSLEIHASTVLL
jgi:hypothetical protein